MIKLTVPKRDFEILLAEKGLTQSDIAKKLKISRNQITALKNRNNGPIGEIKIRKMCKLMDIKFDDYFKKVSKWNI